MDTQLSVIIATYNSGKTLEATLNSLLDQTFENFEVIVVDGLSSDNTVAVIKEFEQKFKNRGIALVWISEKDSGIYDAWNKALKITSSPWISFLGSDDTYYPDALQTYSSEITKHPDINFICSKVEYIDSNGNVLKMLKNPYNYNQLIRYMDFAHVGAFHHHSLFLSSRGFDTNYKIVGDYDFFMKCGQAIKAGFIDKTTARMLNQGISNNNVKRTLDEVREIQLKYKKTPVYQIYFEYYYAVLRILANKGKTNFANLIK